MNEEENMSTPNKDALAAAAPELFDVLRRMLFDDNGKEWIDSEMSEAQWDSQLDQAKQDARRLIETLTPKPD